MESDPLDAAAIRAALGARARSVAVQVLERCASTNSVLLERRDADRCALVAAEEQSAGRGRRGRRWTSPRGAGLTFSLACAIARPLREAAGLPLVAGVAAARALREMGAHEVRLKWPNDLVARGGKLGGILIETRRHGRGVFAVIGFGVNWHRAPDLAARLRRRLAFLEELASPCPPRGAGAGRLAASLLEALDEFEARGLAAVRGDWEALHAHAGRRMRVRLADGRELAGVAEGLAEDGALRLRTRRGVRAIAGASVVSARPA
jgi:BirA family biotin operon repressor/biotin-[acetyl-CoA-carboxylase] ligase